LPKSQGLQGHRL